MSNIYSVTDVEADLYYKATGYHGSDEDIVKWLQEAQPVNHITPSHYTDMKISPLEYIEANPHLTWSLANAIKYISRAGNKEGNPILQELNKAAWYLQHEIDRLSNDNV